jgi:hypothetical protein
MLAQGTVCGLPAQAVRRACVRSASSARLLASFPRIPGQAGILTSAAGPSAAGRSTFCSATLLARGAEPAAEAHAEAPHDPAAAAAYRLQLEEEEEAGLFDDVEGEPEERVEVDAAAVPDDSLAVRSLRHCLRRLAENRF